MKPVFLFIALVSLSLVFNSCKKKTSSGPAGNIVMSMWESLDGTGTGRHLHLKYQTTMIYGCCNYSLIYSLSRSGNVFTVRFTSVFKPEVCLTSMGPATASIDLGVLTNDNYTINTINGGLNSCSIAVSSQSYIISGMSGSSVSYYGDTIMRVPDNTIWGEVCYDSTGAYPALLTTFMDSLAAYGATTVPLTPGNYHFFRLLGANTFPHDSGCSWSQQFIYRYTGDTATLRRLVWHYWWFSDSTFYINLVTDKGYNYMSWYQH